MIPAQEPVLMRCKICNNIAHQRLELQDVIYWQCVNCKVLFSEPLDQEGKVGGGAEIERNSEQNGERIQRLSELCLEMRKLSADVYVLDWGAGHGLLIEDLKKSNFPNVYGYDPFNPVYAQLPERDKFDLVVSVEVFEHFAAPYFEISAINRSMKKGGLLYVETGFLNAAWEDGISEEENTYISPVVGHSTIWTHHGLDLIMAMKGFIPQQKFNRHAHIYKKL